jgi:hypothetical protein
MPFIRIQKCLNCGIKHEWLFDGTTLKELRNIKKITGLNLKGFGQAADDGDPEAIAALLYILHKRDKITVPFEDIDVDFKDFEQEPTEDELKALREAGLLDDEDPKAETATENGPITEAA